MKLCVADLLEVGYKDYSHRRPPSGFPLGRRYLQRAAAMLVGFVPLTLQWEYPPSESSGLTIGNLSARDRRYLASA